MTMINEDAFKSIFQRTLQVALPISETTLTVRRLPFTTLTGLLTEAISRLQIELSVNGGTFSKLLDDIATATPQQSKDAKQDSIIGYKIMAALFPALTGLATSAPSMLKRLLLDVIVDADEALIAALPSEDALAVITTVMQAVDKAVLAKQLDEFFFALTETVKSMKILTAKPDSEKTPKLKRRT